MRFPCSALLILGLMAPATAQDDVDIDDLMNSMDLGPEGVREDEYVNEMTYEGHLSENADGYAPGKPVTITHYGGNITVLCQEQEGITARLAYTVWGTNEANMERFGKGVGIKTWGTSNSGGVTTRTPSKYSGINRYDLPLTVNLPKKADVTVKGGNGWVQVDGCEGTVSVSNKKDGAFVGGTYSRVNVSSSQGDVKVHLTDDSKLSGANRITASGGMVEVKLPTTYDGKFYAKGDSVQVFHTVSGTNNAGLVQGTVGPGTASNSLTISASGAVDVGVP